MKDTKERTYDREEVTELLGGLRTLMSLVFYMGEEETREESREGRELQRERRG